MDLKRELKNRSKKYEKAYSKFIQWLDEVKEKDDAYFENSSKLVTVYINVTKNSKHPKVFFALFSFFIHLNSIKNAILVLSEDNNIYCVKAIYRIFLEHWLKGMYIWVRYTKEKTDDVGMDYVNLGRISEDIKYGKSLKQINKILEAEENMEDVWDVLSKYNPRLKKINKNDFEEKIKKFEYKNIAKYLVDNKAPGSEWVYAIISEYSELSSFVHGGPRAGDQYMPLTSNNSQFKEYKGTVRFSFNMCQTFAFSIFALMLKDLNNKEKQKVIPILSKFRSKEWVII